MEIINLTLDNDLIPTQQFCLVFNGLNPGDHLLVILMVHIGSIDLHNPGRDRCHLANKLRDYPRDSYKVS